MSLLNTKTKVTISGVSLGIYTWYQECLGYLNFWINGSPKVIEGVNFIEGELGYKIENSSDFFFINSDGELVVNSGNPDQYSIDSNGDLTTNIDFCGNPL